MSQINPIGSVSNAARSNASSAPSQYTVHKGDNLSDIAARHGISLSALQAANPDIAKQRFIFPGDKLVIPNGNSATHVVHRGETLSKIAAQNNTSVDALMRSNPAIRNADQIYPGQKINIPHEGAKASPRVQSEQAQIANNTESIATQQVGQTTGILTPGSKSIKAADIAERAAAGLPSKGKCYAWVKQALLKSGAVPVYLEGVPAKGSGPQLEKYGFVNVLGKPGYNIKSPYDAPKGAVLVYGAAPSATDKNAKYGHIEIRTDKGFASDYSSARARTGDAANGLIGKGPKARVLIGVYIKPDAGAKLVQVPSVSPQVASTAATGTGLVGTNDLIAKLGKVITIGEGNYESYNSGTKGVKDDKVGHSFVHPKAGTVTNMTINQILATESKSGTDASRMFATGKYQTTIGTLRAAKTAMGLTGNEKYTPEMQEKVFREFLLDKAGGGKLAAFVNQGKGTVETAQYAASKEWASIAVPAGLRIGKYNPTTKQYDATGPISNGRMSYYEKPGQNAASTTATRELRELLMQIEKSRN
jgi:LysM repeat protein